MNSSNFRTFLAIFLSLFIFFGIKYLYTNPQILSPDNIYAGITQKTAQLKTKISSIRLPNLANLFTLNFKLSNSEPTNQLTNVSPSINFGQAPTGIWQPTPTNFIPTPTLYLRPTSQPFKPSPTLIKNPTPTESVKPTKKPPPAPTSYAPKEDIRPGQDLDDIFEIASGHSCAPMAAIKAIIAQETPGIYTMSLSQVLLYNSYKWWYRVETKQEICSGQAYHPGDNLIPQDSNFGGEICFPDKIKDYKSTSIGAGMIIDSTWNSFKGEVKNKLKVKEVDRRVLLDALIGVGLILKSNAGSGSSCKSWDIKTLKKAACIYYSGRPCTSATAFYCNVVCNNYNKYSGGNLNCSVCYSGN